MAELGHGAGSGRPRVVVVGAGSAGLTAARALAARCDVVVLDKGRRVGGRLATRRIGDAFGGAKVEGAALSGAAAAVAILERLGG